MHRWNLVKFYGNQSLLKIKFGILELEILSTISECLASLVMYNTNSYSHVIKRK